MQKPSLERLKELLTYDPSKGGVYTRKGRLLIPDTDGLVTIFDQYAKTKRVKYKLERIAYYLAFGVYPREDQKVLHKNLDDSDNSIKNLSLVSKSVYRQIKEAQKNLEGAIRITPHPEDQFSFILSWYDKGKEVQKTVYDIGIAKRQQVRLQLKYSKILTKYCVFD